MVQVIDDRQHIVMGACVTRRLLATGRPQDDLVCLLPVLAETGVTGLWVKVTARVDGPCGHASGLCISVVVAR